MKTSFTNITQLLTLFMVLVLHNRHSAKCDTCTIDVLNQDAWNLRNQNLELAKQKALEAIKASESIHYIRGLSYSYNVLGHYYKVKSNYDSAEFFYQKSLAIRQQLNDTITIASSYRNIMSIYKLKGQLTQAVEVGLIAIQLLTPKLHQANAEKEKARVQNNLSALYLKMGSYESAIKNALEAKQIFIKHKEEEGLASITITLGNIYEEQKEYTNAISQFEEAIQLHQASNNKRELAKAYNGLGNVYYAMAEYNMALQNYQQSLTIRETNSYTDDIAGSYYSMGIIYESIEQPNLAYTYYIKSLNYAQKAGNNQGIYETFSALGSLMRQQKKFDSAFIYLREALQLTNSAGALPERLALLQEISKTHKQNGNNDSALIYTEYYTQLNDSLHEILRSAIKQESTIKEREYDLKLTKEKNKTQLYIIAGLTLSLLLVLTVLFYLYRSSKSNKRLRQLKDIIKEQELLALDAMLEGQERERKRLSLELHDTIGSILAATKFAFKSMENNLEKLVTENKVQYQKINTMLDEAMDSVRKISHEMAEGIVLEKGIEGALKQLCERLEIPGKLSIAVNTYGFNEKVDSNIELNLYRAVQELLTNILKHAQANTVVIQLTKSDKTINLMVEDDGKGFQPQTISDKTGIGLSNIDNRVKKLNGKWNIDSGKGKGTTVIIDIPLNNEII